MGPYWRRHCGNWYAVLKTLMSLTLLVCYATGIPTLFSGNWWIGLLTMYAMSPLLFTETRSIVGTLVAFCEVTFLFACCCPSCVKCYNKLQFMNRCIVRGIVYILYPR